MAYLKLSIHSGENFLTRVRKEVSKGADLYLCSKILCKPAFVPNKNLL